MPYRFALSAEDYTDLASGRVFEGSPGHPAFPLRLASEIFQRCAAIREAPGDGGPVTVYDPCCGGATLLGAVAYLHGESIGRVVGSDVDAGILPLAVRNLDLLTVEGIERRIVELGELVRRFGKDSHRQALKSAERMRRRIEYLRRVRALTTRVFSADVLTPAALGPQLASEHIDVVITDVPYGSGSTWSVPASVRGSPIQAMLESLLPFLTPRSVVAISADKKQPVGDGAFRRLERFQIGKRRVEILGPDSR